MVIRRIFCLRVWAPDQNLTKRGNLFRHHRNTIIVLCHWRQYQRHALRFHYSLINASQITQFWGGYWDYFRDLWRFAVTEVWKICILFKGNVLYNTQHNTRRPREHFLSCQFHGYEPMWRQAMIIHTYTYIYMCVCVCVCSIGKDFRKSKINNHDENNYLWRYGPQLTYAENKR